jgi:uncharacterized membrane protein YczE
VLAERIADHSRLDIGGATILLSVLVLVGWIPLRQRPGLGTGPGPRDGWMTGIHRRLGHPIASVRVAIELTVLAVGVVLGGTVGVATFAFALFVGYCLAWTLQVFARHGGSSRRP